MKLDICEAKWKWKAENEELIKKVQKPESYQMNRKAIMELQWMSASKDIRNKEEREK